MYKGQSILPKDYIKILSVLIDTSLKYYKYIISTAIKGLEVVLELRKLKGILLIVV